VKKTNIGSKRFSVSSNALVSNRLSKFQNVMSNKIAFLENLMKGVAVLNRKIEKVVRLKLSMKKKVDRMSYTYETLMDIIR